MNRPFSLAQTTALALLTAVMVAGACSSNEQNSGGAPRGGICTKAADCASGVCTAGTCQGGPSASGTAAGQTPIGQPTGGSCSTSADCAGDGCVAGVCQPTVPPPAGSVSSSSCTNGMMGGGMLGCACGPMGMCGPGLMCMGGKCCDMKTKNCGATASSGGPGASGGPGVSGGTGNPSGGTTTSGSACKPGVVGPVITNCGYPYQSTNPLTELEFNESEVLAAIVPSGGYPLAAIQLFYNDEHAMTLGVREVVVNGASTPYSVTPLASSPSAVNSPETGANALTGDQAGVDPDGRPMWPALFVTDITNDANALSGDWQWGGAAVNPTYVAGTWKGAVRTVDASGASITPDADPAKNAMNYGNGHTAPSGAIGKSQDYGAEVRWDMRLQAGHNYRFQVMVHDGDQNKVGGDTGEACVTFCAGNGCPTGVQTCSTDADCSNGYSCSAGCCVPPPPPPPPKGDSGTCPPNWVTYLQTEGQAICTPPPTNGGCPQGYVITVIDNRQWCLPVVIR